MSHESELTNLLAFVGILLALVLLFAAGLRLPVQLSTGNRVLSRTLIGGAALLVAVLANLAMFRHDAHIDLTREKAFTPSQEASDIVAGLTQPVMVTYFYQSQNQAARALNTTLVQLQRRNRNLTVRLVDVDQNPALASSLGVRMYNAAILRTADRRVEVITTDDREIGLGLLRLLRKRETVICFVTGHGEYDIDNFEFHTHFEGTHSHSHDVQGLAVVLTEQHGLGRLRNSLEKLGLAARKIILSDGRPVPQECAALVEANPRTKWTPPETDVVQAYLERGGSALFLIEPDYALEPRMAALLSQAGIAVRDGIVVDPVSHYFTDEQMIAVTSYGAHQITRGLALSFYPGARPLENVSTPRARTTTLVATSAQAYVIADKFELEQKGKDKPRAAWPLAIAAEGRLARSSQDRDYRLTVFGDADFASNSFFPYLANADTVLATLSWLIREERAPAMKPPIEVLPTVTLTNGQMRGIFLVTVLIMPGLLALAGGAVWFARR